MSVKDGLNAEQVAAKRRAQEAARERVEWAQLYYIYDRCVVIAESVWDERLEKAGKEQRATAEAMRDRWATRTTSKHPDGHETIAYEDGAIPVPLFTPRDRLQFIKEVAATLLISADRKNLTAIYKEPSPDVEAQEAPAGQSPVEAASGADEAIEDATQYGERVSQAPAPSV